jgi:hypothetical protein
MRRIPHAILIPAVERERRAPELELRGGLEAGERLRREARRELDRAQ